MARDPNAIATIVREALTWQPPEFREHPGPRPTETTVRGICKGLTDGDTLDVMIEQRCGALHYIRCRLLDVDAPETNSKDPYERAHGLTAKSRMAELAVGRSVIVDLHHEAMHQGRMLSDVLVYRGKIEPDDRPTIWHGLTLPPGGLWRDAAEFLKANKLTKADVPRPTSRK